ncbi:UDP-N-acetylmuramoyl-L-alanyl-D-glutamate--2,6-diaminopimelate ligase [Myxococcota bacterium]|nr:UDP-N-acetylmuramoyl-L-alanyl-D-glutamate--2,6-diaminopimelate ligase [Myxococcota bacterium]
MSGLAPAPLSRLLQALPEVPERRGAPDVPVRGLAYDSRRVGPGELFAAIPGSTADGHRFVAQAIAAGASAVLLRDWPEGPWPAGVAGVRVSDPRRALARLAAALHGDPSRGMTVVAVTGTNGKTTSASLIAGMLAAGGARTALLGTTGTWFEGERRPSERTTPEGADLHALLGELRARGAGAVALEASSHALDQGRLAGLHVDVALYTHLSRDHLDYHGSMDAYAAAKERLVTEVLAQSGKGGRRGLAANADDPAGAAIAAKWPNTLRFSARGQARADVAVEEARFGIDGFEARVRTPRGPVELRSPLVGAHNLENALGALAVGLLLGLSAEDAAAGIGAVGSVPGRLERVRAEGTGPSVFVDYAHSDDALARVLEALRPLTRGRLTCVFGCGGDRDRGKRPLMAAAAARGADRVVLTSDNPRSEDPLAILADAAAGLPPGADAVVEPDRASAIALAVAEAGPDDVVLVAGKGHEGYQEVGTRRVPFDDRAHARAALAAPRKAR